MFKRVDRLLMDLPGKFAPGMGPDQFEAIAKRLLANM